MKIQTRRLPRPHCDRRLDILIILRQTLKLTRNLLILRSCGFYPRDLIGNFGVTWGVRWEVVR
jgi:hypothetical protein